MGFISQYESKYQTGGLQHLFAKNIQLEVGTHIFDDYFKFSFVRNPWDKAISQFHYMRHRADLREFVGMDLDDSFHKYLALIQKKTHVQWDEQYKFIYSDDDELMVDFLGRFENFEQDVNTLVEILGVKMSSIPHSNRTHHRPYYEYYDNEARELVRMIYKRDITLFGYEFRDTS